MQANGRISVGFRRGSAQGRLKRRDDDWLGDFEADDRPLTRARPTASPVAEPEEDLSTSSTTSHSARTWRKKSVVTRIRRMETPGMPHLAPSHKAAIVTVTLGTFLILAAFVYGLVDRLGSWGYLGAFLISLLTSATIILPAPGGAVIFIMAEKLNPFLLGIIAGLGGGIGGITAYAVGAVGRNALRRRRVYSLLAKLFGGRWGPFLLFVFTLIPFLPMDLVSAMAGAVRYSIPRYLVWTTSASIIKMVLIAFLGAFATGWLFEHVQEWIGMAPKG